MAGSCTEEELVYGVPKTLENLTVEVYDHPEPDAVRITATADCFSGGERRYYNLGTTHTIECEESIDGKWEVNYYRYIAEDIIRVIVCFIEGEAEPTPCPDHTTKEACEAAGCYWYDESCHTSDEETEEGDLTDYERIKEDVVDSLLPVLTGIGLVDQAISDVKTVIDDVSDSLDAGITGLLGDLTEVIDGVKDYLSDEISGLSAALTTGFEGVEDSIDGLTIPTIEGIKAGFLDVCEDLAAALWDRIIDEIEERYPDDEEGGD